MVNSSTNSGTPSARSTIWATTSSGNALPPAICSTKAVRSRRSRRLSASMVTCGWPVQGGWNSGRNVTISSTGRLRTRSTVRSSSSREVGSIQCASSKTMTTGCWRARPSSCRISASSVRSFLRCGLRFGSGWRSEARQRQQIGEECHILVGRRGAGQQGLELLQPGSGRVVAREPRCPAELVDEREQRAVLVIGRAEIAQAEMRLGVEALLQCRGDARLADAGLARDQHDLAVARLGARPAPQQQVDLLVAADQRRQRRSAQCLEPARDDARPQYLPGRHRRGDALDLDGAEIAVLEEIADQPARARGDDDRVRLGQGLQPGGEVRASRRRPIAPAPSLRRSDRRRPPARWRSRRAPGAWRI